MKLCSFFLLLFLVSSVAFGHPGKTDYQDGHKCLKNCEDWEMNYDEYHLHDKDRNAIRSEGRKKPLREPAPAKKSEPEPLLQEVVATPVPPSPESQAEQRRMTARLDQGYSMPVDEESMVQLSDILLFSVASLLLLVKIYLRRKREKE